METENLIYDVAVIGGGPAGMMAAGTAAKKGRSVLLLEKNPALGKKLLLTGGGRCNITNNKTDIRTMLKNYKGNDQFLFSAFVQFSVRDTLNFFSARGLDTKEENDGRMFPVTNKSQSVFDVLKKYMREEKVTIHTGAEVAGLSLNADKNIVIKLKDGKKIIAKSCIVATGGTSHPETGSTGEGFMWLKKLGHTIIENDYALVPIALKDSWVKKISGVALNNVKLTLIQNNKKELIKTGNVLFTHFGISGPTVLNMSKTVGDYLKEGEVVIELDLFPKLDLGTVRRNFQALLAKEPNKKLKNILPTMFPSAFAECLLEMAGIDGNTANNFVSAQSRKKITELMKKIPLHVDHLLGKEKAIVSSGGVALEEVNFKTMQSKIVPNIFLVGDVLNIDRPSGGYSLQLCWTTGFVAGNNA